MRGGDGGRGAPGEVHDSTLWKEPSSESVGDREPVFSVTVSIRADFSGAAPGSFDAGAVTMVSCGGAVTDRLV